jgi:hypothetical protein
VSECSSKYGFSQLRPYFGQLFSGVQVTHCYLLTGVFLVAYVLFGNISLMATLFISSAWVRDTVLLEQHFPEKKSGKSDYILSRVPYLAGLVLFSFFLTNALVRKQVFCISILLAFGLQFCNNPKRLNIGITRTLLITPTAFCFYWLSEHDCIPHPLKSYGASLLVYAFCCIAINYYIMAAVKQLKNKYSLLLLINLFSLIAVMRSISFEKKELCSIAISAQTNKNVEPDTR